MFLIQHGRIAAHIVQLFLSGMLTQVNTLLLRCSGIVVSGAVLSRTTLSLRDVIVVPPLVREGRRRSHIRRGNILPLLVLLPAAPLPLGKEQGTGTNPKRRNTLVHVLLNVTNMLRNTRGRGVLLHLLQFLHLLLFSREVRPGRSLELVLGHLLRLMRKLIIPLPGLRVRLCPRDHLSLYADDDEINSHTEDHQDLVPEAEIHSNVSSEDMKFQNLIEEVF